MLIMATEIFACASGTKRNPAGKASCANLNHISKRSRKLTKRYAHLVKVSRISHSQHIIFPLAVQEGTACRTSCSGESLVLLHQSHSQPCHVSRRSKWPQRRPPAQPMETKKPMVVSFNTQTPCCSVALLVSVWFLAVSSLSRSPHCRIPTPDWTLGFYLVWTSACSWYPAVITCLTDLSSVVLKAVCIVTNNDSCVVVR